jgi:WD40 repeat protein
LTFSIKTNDDSLATLAKDARKFVVAFGSAISQSVPHIYLSALPFAPKNSTISKNYLPHFSNTLSIRPGEIIDWPVLQLVLEGHDKYIVSVAFSNDGKHVVAGDDDGTILAWDTDLGDIVLGPFQDLDFDKDTDFICYNYSFTQVMYSPDDTRIISGWHGGVAVRDGEDITDKDLVEPIIRDTKGKIIGEPDRKKPDSGKAVAYSQDGKNVICNSRDKANEFSVWDIETWAKISGPFVGHPNEVTCIAVSRDGKCIASGSIDGTIRVWNPETTQSILDMCKGDTGSINHVAISHNGQRIASISGMRVVWIWDAQTGQVVSRPCEGNEIITCLAFSPNGSQIATSGYDCVMRLWDVERGIAVCEPFAGHAATINCIAWSQDGTRIASGSEDKTVIIWDALTKWSVPSTYPWPLSAITAAGIFTDGTRIVTTSNESRHIWDVETGKVIFGPFPSSSVYFALSRDGKHIAVEEFDNNQEGQTLDEFGQCGYIVIKDVETGQPISQHFRGCISVVKVIAFIGDGKYIAAGFMNRTVCLWDVETGTMISAPLEGLYHYVKTIAGSSDGRLITSSDIRGTLIVWNLETGKAILGPLDANVDSVSFSLDDQLILTGGTDGKVKVWEVKTGNVTIGPMLQDGGVIDAAFSPDGKQILSVTQYGAAYVWNTKDGSLIDRPIQCGTGTFILGATIFQDGKRIFSYWNGGGRISNMEKQNDFPGSLCCSSNFVWS